tara:strand:+ start:214 stop:594 length:381 start_codon:yes stop_codon:yes gene_type:complete
MKHQYKGLTQKTVQTAQVVEDSTNIKVGPGPPRKVTKQDQIKNITFHDGDITLGEISWDTGEFQFKGDMDASAEIFFNQVLKNMCDGYIEKYKNIDLELKALLLHCTKVLKPHSPQLVKEIKKYFT